MVEKRGEQESVLANKLVLKRAVEHKVRIISEKAFISEREVYDLVRSFFKKYLNVDYEFTSDELMREMKKVYLPAELQQRARMIIDRVSEMEHLSRTFSKEELTHILTEFRALVEALISSHYENKSFVGKVRDALHGSTQDSKGLLDETTLLNENERIIVRMNMLLDNARRWADKDLAAAKKAYQDLLVLYNALDDEKKNAYFKPVNELFALLRNKGGG